jgi:hypothetical protein
MKERASAVVSQHVEEYLVERRKSSHCGLPAPGGISLLQRARKALQLADEFLYALHRALHHEGQSPMQSRRDYLANGSVAIPVVTE